MTRSWSGRLTVLLLILLVPVLGPAQPIPPERRIALVIGIGAYQNAPPLANPVNDARAIGEALRRLNFEVDEVYDPDFRGLSRAVREFGIKAQRADVAVIYYAGHGVQVGRENYLLPADARLERERDLLYEALPLELLLGEASQAQQARHRPARCLPQQPVRRPHVALHDHCRPRRRPRLAWRAWTTCRATPWSSWRPRPTRSPRTAAATTAPSPRRCWRISRSPGLELSLFFRSVRDTVLRATGNRQEPFIFSSLGAEPFYFYPRPPNRPPVLAAIPALELRDSAGPTPLPITRPTDPDQDPLTVRITGLPRSGEVRVEGRPVTPGAVFAADRFMTATYKPDRPRDRPGRHAGHPGGGWPRRQRHGQPADHRAAVATDRRWSRRRGGCGYTPARWRSSGPTDPDGDALSVTILALPRGILRNGTTILRGGERLQPEELSVWSPARARLHRPCRQPAVQRR